MSAQHRRNPDMFPRTAAHIHTMSDADREEQARQIGEQEAAEDKQAQDKAQVKADALYDQLRDAGWTADSIRLGVAQTRKVMLLTESLRALVGTCIRHEWVLSPGEPDTISEAMDLLQDLKGNQP